METKYIEKLRNLNDELVLEGCINYEIPGIMTCIRDGVFSLEQKNGKWEVNYFERGIAMERIYSTCDLDDAIIFYKNHIMNLEHWHLVIVTKNENKYIEYKNILENNGITIIRNDLPAHSAKENYLFRIFVKNKDIFKARELFQQIPYKDL